MYEHKECPECGSANSTKQWVDHQTDVIEVVRTCDDCPTQWTVSYGNPEQRDVQTFEE